MNMVNLSVYFCCLQFLSSMTYSFKVQSFLVKLIPKSIVFWNNYKWGYFLISLSYHLLLVYRNARVFYILKFFFWIHFLLLKVFGIILGFSMYSVISSTNNYIFTPSFPILMAYICFSSLIAMARTSNTVLNKSNNSEHPSLLLDCREVAFRFSWLSVISAIGLPYMAFIMSKYMPSILTLLRVFITSGCSILSGLFSAPIKIIIWVLIFNLLML